MPAFEFHYLHQHEIEEFGMPAQFPHQRMCRIAHEFLQGLSFHRLQKGIWRNGCRSSMMARKTSSLEAKWL